RITAQATDPVHTGGAPVGGRAYGAAAPAVGDAGVGVDLAAVGRIAITVSVPRVTGRLLTDSIDAHGGLVGSRADKAAGPTVLGVRGEVRDHNRAHGRRLGRADLPPGEHFRQLPKGLDGESVCARRDIMQGEVSAVVGERAERVAGDVDGCPGNGG